MIYLQETVRKILVQKTKSIFKILPEDIQFSVPTNRKFGDLSTTLPFIIAKRTQEKPYIVGQKILEILQKNEIEFCEKISLANGGFLNFYFKKNFLLNYSLRNLHRKPPEKQQKIVVEHTSINPNKSAHIGHLRNACLGDTLAKSLKYLGYSVEIQNYLDDTGIQVSDVVWGLLRYQNKNLEDIKRIDNLAGYLWQLYIEVSKLLKDNQHFAAERNEVHKKIEQKINPEYNISNYVAEEVLKNHLWIMSTIGIEYDLLVRESDIIELDFFKEAAEVLKDRKIMYRSSDPGKHNCWVIKYDKENIEKIIIRSNETVTYIGKDIAYTLWKLGLFKKDFYYRPFSKYDNGKIIHISNDKEGKVKLSFGRASRVYNVIDTRQSYLQNIIAQILESLLADSREKNFFHFSYEMVALTPRCVEEMGFTMTQEERKKPYVEVSGRRGIAVKAEELIDMLVQKSLEEVKLRHPKLKEEETLQIAQKIAIGALRYFMIKFNSKSIIAFDFKDALSFDGDTGPYLQYTLVRTNSILRKMNLSEPGVDKFELTFDQASEKEVADYYELLLSMASLDAQVEFALKSNELSVLANFTYVLCQKFNQYYHKYSIISEKDSNLRNLRLGLIWLVKNTLERLFTIMGIPVPEKM